MGVSDTRHSEKSPLSQCFCQLASLRLKSPDSLEKHWRIAKKHWESSILYEAVALTN
jgi:hypothetical protein